MSASGRYTSATADRKRLEVLMRTMSFTSYVKWMTEAHKLGGLFIVVRFEWRHQEPCNVSYSDRDLELFKPVLISGLELNHQHFKHQQAMTYSRNFLQHRLTGGI